jgi:hypothetical protein
MGADRNLLLRAFIRAAKLQNSANPRAPLEAIILGQFTSVAQNGKTIVSTSRDGLSATFTLPPGMGPGEILALAEEAIEYLNGLPDPTNPNLSPRRIKRLRANFQNVSC